MSFSSPQTYTVLGVLMQFLIEPESTSFGAALIRSELTPKTVIPLHSHADAEMFYVLSGTIEAYVGGWNTFVAGQTFSITGGIKHALRNLSDRSTFVLAVTEEQLYKFFRELAVPFSPEAIPSAPSPEATQHVLAVAAKYEFWLGSPEDNAKAGITLG